MVPQSGKDCFMKKSKLKMKFLISLLIFPLVFQLMLFPAFAEEVAEEEAVEGSEDMEGVPEDGEGGDPEAAEESEGGIVPGTVQADNGKYIAVSFPDSIMPAGFTSTTVPYEGTEVKLAQMQTNSTTIGAEGMVVTLAYLTDEGGANGDFYLCDVTENAHMSDMIMVHGVEDNYIIILDPGDNINGPDGFTKRKLKWGSKTAVAWALPEDTASEEEEKEEKEEEEEEDKESRSFFTERVYADELPGVGAGAGGGSDEIDEAAEKAMSDYIAESDIAHTNAAGLIQAQPDDFCLLYAVSESGDVGFYLYDIKFKTYQRYVEIPHGESATLAKYRKQSRIRLFIIAGLILVLIVLVFLLINTMLRTRRGGVNEGYREREENIRVRHRRRVREEEEEDEDEEDEEDDGEAARYEAAMRAGRPRRNPSSVREPVRAERTAGYAGGGVTRSPGREDPYRENPDPYRGNPDPYRDSRGPENTMRSQGMRDPGMREPVRRDAGMREPAMRNPGMRDSSMRDPGMREPSMRPMREAPQGRNVRRPEEEAMMSPGGGRRSAGVEGGDLDDDFTFEFLNVDQ